MGAQLAKGEVTNECVTAVQGGGRWWRGAVACDIVSNVRRWDGTDAAVRELYGVSGQ